MLKVKYLGIIFILALLCTQAFAFEQVTSLNETSRKTFQNDLSWNNYIKFMDQKLRSNWFPSKANNEVEVVFKITKNGTYKNLRISKPSPNKLDNQAAIDAVMYASPFKSFPHQANELLVKYQFTTNNNYSNNIHFIVLK